jgi:hypothetical protein
LTETVTKHCSICNDTGWKIVEKEGREFAQKCECQAMEIYKTVGQKSNIPQRFLGYELNSYMPQDENPSQKKQ